MYYVYILTNKPNGVLYIGITNDLVKRVYQHKQNLVEGFTKKYHVHMLVYFEQFQQVKDAILREKQMKSRMILQVHDELVFEVPAGEQDPVSRMVRHEMENAATLDVPLKVDVGAGRNWAEAH